MQIHIQNCRKRQERAGGSFGGGTGAGAGAGGAQGGDMSPDAAYQSGGGGVGGSEIKKPRRNINLNTGQNIIDSKIGKGIGKPQGSFKNLNGGGMNGAP